MSDPVTLKPRDRDPAIMESKGLGTEVDVADRSAFRDESASRTRVDAEVRHVTAHRDVCVQSGWLGADAVHTVQGVFAVHGQKQVKRVLEDTPVVHEWEAL